MAHKGLSVVLAFACAFATVQCFRTDIKQLYDFSQQEEQEEARAGKCQRSCSVLQLNPWLGTGGDADVHTLLDAKCTYKSCSKCDGKKHGSWTPCCVAGGCSRAAKNPPVVADPPPAAADPPPAKTSTGLLSMADIEADLRAVEEIASRVDVDADEDGVAINEFEALLKDAGWDSQGNSSDSQEQVSDVPEVTPVEPECPAKVLWNHKGFPRCRNYVPGDEKYMKFVKTMCCDAEIQKEMEAAAAARMCQSLENTPCKKAEGKFRKKRHQGESKVQEHMMKVFADERVPGKFPQGFTCVKMYVCDTGDVLVGPQKSCHVQKPSGEKVTIGTARNTCVAMPSSEME